ncbi:MAG: MBL fold metallo-hydrolase [Chloroflexi bacterium]|nr:MBL fold metallo-hydrolase [Chloroflexota bacterium]
MTLHKIVIPTSFPIGPVNVYLVEGDPLTLIDTGPRTDEALQTLEQGVAALGYALGDIRRIIITHTHPDHFGLVRQLVERSGASIWTHPFNADWFNNLALAVQRRGEFTLQLFKQSGVPDALIDMMRQMSPVMGQFFEEAPTDHWLDDGDTLEMDGALWQTVFTPGHAGGHIALYQPQTQQMVVGDHLLKYISSNPLIEAPHAPGLPRAKALVQYLDSLKKVAALDVAVAYPGHGDNINDHRLLIAERISFHEQRAERIAALLDQGERTAYQLVQEMFPRLADFDIFLGLSEVIGHLDILQLQGRVIEAPRNGHLVYASQ